MRDGTQSTGEYPSNIEQIIEAGGPNIKWRFVSPSLNGRLPRLRHSVAPHRLLNKNFKDDSLQSGTGGYPDSPCYFYVGLTSADGNTDPPAVYINVTITYYCDFFDRIENQPQN